MGSPVSYADVKICEAEAVGDQATADYWRHIRATVDQAPPLTQQQRAQLRFLCAPRTPIPAAPVA